MRFSDVIRFALSALRQQKVRTALTLLGVSVGAFVLVASLSISVGVQGVIAKEFRRNDQLRQITIWGGRAGEPKIPPEEMVMPEGMDDVKKARLLDAVKKRLGWKYSQPKSPLTLERLREIAAFDHVASVFPDLFAAGRAVINGKSEEVLCTGAPANYDTFKMRVIAGRFIPDDNSQQVVVGEYLLYRLGMISDEAIDKVLGQKLRLEFRGFTRSPRALINVLNPGMERVSTAENEVLDKVLKQLPTALEKIDLTAAERDTLQGLLKRQSPQARWNKEFHMSREFTIVGIVRDLTTEEETSARMRMHVNFRADVILPLDTAKKFFAEMPYHETDGFNSATVTVDHEDHVRDVVQKLKAEGYEPFSLIEVLERIQRNARLITFVTAFVAAIALLVACLGITNTMLMTVLERTHEIGVMKAVGARDRHIEMIFLVEGAILGLVGGGLGLLFAWCASFPGNAVAQAMIEKETEGKLEHTVFVFPLWLTLGIPLFAALVTTLAALYPARRAARINPILALRHE